MSVTCEETLAVPLWVTNLEDRLKVNLFKKRSLLHETGAGAPCLVCRDLCPGLDLHFWRNNCKICKCQKEEHDFDDPDSLRFKLLFENENDVKKKLKKIEDEKLFLKVKVNEELSQGNPTKLIKFDWVPQDVSVALASDYMNQLPDEKKPISGTPGAENRKLKLKKQIPMQDVVPSPHITDNNEKLSYFKYLEQIRQNSGIGQIFRVKKFIPSTLGDISSTYPNQNCKESLDGLNNLMRNLNFQLGVPRGYLPPQTDNGIPQGYLPSPAFAQTNSGIRQGYFPAPAYAQMNYKTPQRYLPGSNEIPPSIQVDPVNYEIVHSTVVKDLPNSNHSESLSQHRDATANLNNSNQHPLLRDHEFVNQAHMIANASEVPQPQKSEVFLTADDIQCTGCKNIIQDSSVAVFVDKSEPSVLAWHPQCFVCKVCKELLVDLVYIYNKSDKSVYCGRHYPKALKIHRCFGCDELILKKKFTFAEEHYYHVEHFCCDDCDIELGGMEYMVNERTKNKPVCVSCYDDKYAERCHTCDLNIKTKDKAILYSGMHWHARCFKCGHCDKPLDGQMFMVANNLPFCSVPCRNSRFPRL